MRILKLIATLIATTTIMSQRFMQEAPKPAKIHGLKIRKMVHCYQFENQCNNLTPKATGCVWTPGAFIGLCGYIDEQGIIQTTFDN